MKNISIEKINVNSLAKGEFVLLLHNLENHFKLEIRENIEGNYSELKKEYLKYSYYFHLWGKCPEGKEKVWEDGPWAKIDINFAENEIVVRNDLYRRCDIYLNLENAIIITNSCRYVLANSNDFDKKGLITLLILKYVPPPFSLYKGWYKIPMGYEAPINIIKKKLEFIQYYEIPWYPIINFDDALDELKNNLGLSLSPLFINENYKYGGLVSGGVDSTLLLLMVLKEYAELSKRLFVLSFIRPVDKINDIAKVNNIMKKK